MTNFFEVHPKIAGGIFLGFMAGLGAYTIKSKLDTLTSNVIEPTVQPQSPESPAPVHSNSVVLKEDTPPAITPVVYTDEENTLLEKLRSGTLDGDFGTPLLDNGYGSSIQLEVNNGIPMRVKCGPGGKSFDGKENERWESTPRIDIKWRTDDQKLFFLKKYGFLSDDEDVRAYSKKFKGKV